LMLAVALLPHGERAILSDEATLSLELHTVRLLWPHVQVGSGSRIPGWVHFCLNREIMQLHVANASRSSFPFRRSVRATRSSDFDRRPRIAWSRRHTSSSLPPNVHLTIAKDRVVNLCDRVVEVLFVEETTANIE
jgi:hypothetical protein